MTQSLQAKYPSIISFFPQMKPETPAKEQARPSMVPFLELGIPPEWVEPLHELEISTVTMEQVKEWIS